MAAINVKTLSTSRLLELLKQIDAVLPAKAAEERKHLQSRLMKLESVGGLKGNRAGRTHALKGKKVPAKYRGPDGATWSGRGLKPRWLADALNGGKQLEDFLIAGNGTRKGRPAKRK